MVEKSAYPANGCTLSAAQIETNFSDLHKPLSAVQAISAADSCIYCYDAPCINACPTSIDIPTFIHQIKTANITGSAETILGANILGGTCARACPTEVLCEQACVRNHTGEAPVQIGALQRFAVDHLIAEDGPHPFARANNTGKHIAIIGAGPAGLSCAHRAAMLGHDVTIFEAKAKPGGLNEYGLAAYKMADNFAQREVEFLLNIGGITLQYGQALGQQVSLKDLQTRFDAVFIGVGLGDANTLDLPGNTLPGVESAITFIENLRQSEDKSELSVGNNVIVIGGGNTAIDAAIQAKRLGAKHVTLAYRRGEAQMSATDWEVDLARSNGVNVELWASPASLNGHTELESISFDSMIIEDGTYKPKGEIFTLPADQVLVAIGQTLSSSDLQGLNIEKGKVLVNAHGETSIQGVFAGGDCIASGEDLTVQAVEDGKLAAHAIDQYLRANSETPA